VRGDVETFWKDDGGLLRLRWVVALFFAGVIAVFGVIGLALKVGAEIACNQSGDELQLPADYRFLPNTCYVQLRDGRRVPAQSIRVVEAGR
jgi:hypothetical protein